MTKRGLSPLNSDKKGTASRAIPTRCRNQHNVYRSKSCKYIGITLLYRCICLTFSFQLLDKLWFQVSPLPPPGTCLPSSIAKRVQPSHCSSIVIKERELVKGGIPPGVSAIWRYWQNVRTAGLSTCPNLLPIHSGHAGKTHAAHAEHAHRFLFSSTSVDLTGPRC